MKKIILILFFCVKLFSQDANFDGTIDNITANRNYDLNGDGSININDLPKMILEKYKQSHSDLKDNPSSLSFSPFWSSPAGAFTNSWDGVAGYFDGDTLLDIAGFTFSPAKFYIWEQSPTKPDSFYLVQEFVKAEGGSYGPIVIGDSDGDGKLEIITADVLGIARIYIYENNGNNVYVDQNTQNTLVHPSNSEGGQGIYIGDMNKNGQKEIILLRGTTGGGEVRIWEHTGTTGQPTYSNIYTYTTVSYIFSKGGFGDADNDGWDEVFLTYGGLPTFNTFIRRIEFDSASGTFQHLQFEAPTIGMPAMYKVYDLGNDGVKELIMTCNSNDRAAAYVLRRSGPNSFVKLDSMFESSDNNNMLSCDIKVLSGNTQPTLLMGSFNGRVYTYQYNGTSFIKDYENLSYPGSAIRRVYWLPWTGYDGYFNTWSSTNSNGTYYIFKRDNTTGIINNGSIPEKFLLYQNYPNPFNPNTVISYQLAVNSFIKLSIYDINGKLIETLVNNNQNAGNYTVSFDGKNYASGVYFYRLSAEPSNRLEQSDGYSEIRKMVLLK